jgi:hypothetical protein
MEPYRPSLGRRVASVRRFLGTLQALFKPREVEVRSQRMCSFCGLITPKAKRVCLECGKALGDVSVERIEVKQE